MVVTVEDPLSSRIDKITVDIGLVDVNNIPATFPLLVYEAEVYEGSALGTIVTEIQAVDGDPTFPTLYYTWFLSNQSGIISPVGLFDISTIVKFDDLGNEIYVAQISTAGDISRSILGESVSVLVAVSDGVNGQAVTVLNIDILDLNNFSPKFSLPSEVNSSTIECLDNNTSCKLRQGPTVPEDVDSDVTLYAFSASDSDYGNNGKITFSVTASDEFGINCGESAGLFTVTGNSLSIGGIYHGNLTVDPGRTLDYESQTEYIVCVLASDLGTPSRHDVISVAISVTNVPFKMSVVETNLKQVAPETFYLNGNINPILFFGNGNVTIDVAENGEDGTIIQEINVKTNSVKPMDCVLSPWMNNECLSSDGNLLDTDWKNRWCKKNASNSSGTLSQLRYFWQVRDELGLGADCPRVTGPPPSGQPPLLPGLVKGGIELQRSITCGESLCPEDCKLFTISDNGDNWIPLRNCSYSEPCGTGIGLEAQVVAKLPSNLVCEGDNVGDCETILQYDGQPCGLSGFLGGINLSDAFVLPSTPNEVLVMKPELQAYLSGPIPSPAVLSQWGANLSFSQPGSVINIRLSQCPSTCTTNPNNSFSTPLTSTSTVLTQGGYTTLSQDVDPMSLPPNTSFLLNLSMQSPRNGYERNHPLYDIWEVNGQWLRKEFWYGQALPTGKWNATLFLAKFGYTGEWVQCQNTSSNSNDFELEDQNQGLLCAYSSKSLPEGLNHVAFRAMDLNGSEVQQVNYSILIDTDAPRAFLTACPFDNDKQSQQVSYCKDDGSGSSLEIETGGLYSTNSSSVTISIMYTDSDTSLCNLPICATPLSLKQGCEPCQRGTPVAFYCKLDGDPWDNFEPCKLATSQPQQVTGQALLLFQNLSDGAHKLEIKCIDDAGNDGYIPSVGKVEYQKIVLFWNVDTIAPPAFLTKWPVYRRTGATSVEFSVATTTTPKNYELTGQNATPVLEDNITFFCEIDDSMTLCNSSFVGLEAHAKYHNLEHGTYALFAHQLVCS